MNSYANMACVTVLLSIAATQVGHALNITVSDPGQSQTFSTASSSVWQTSDASWPKPAQSYELGESWSVGGPIWQLEGMSFQVKNGTPWLFLIGGYDFQNRGAIDSVYGPNRYGGGSPGDLFIWRGDGNALAHKGLHSQSAHGNAGLDYAYAVAISDLITDGHLTVYDLNEDTLIDFTRGGGDFLNPWRVKPLKRNLPVDATFVTPAEYYVGQTPAQVSEITGDDYSNLDIGFSLASAKNVRKSKPRPNTKFNVLGIDLSFLFGRTRSDDTIWFEFTNQRGEPVLVGAMQGGFPVADGGLTVALLGFSLFVLRVAHRAKR